MTENSFSRLFKESTEAKRNMGERGEQLVAEAFGGYRTETAAGDDNGIDVVAHDGTLVDVKTTNYQKGHLLVRADRKHYHNTDFFALVTPDDDGDYRLRGVMAAADVYASRPRRWPSSHLNHIFQRSDLDHPGDHGLLPVGDC